MQFRLNSLKAYTNTIDLSNLCCSSENDYIPLSSLFNMKFRIENDFYYTKVSLTKSITSQSIAFFLRAFQNKSLTNTNKFFYPELPYFYYTSLGDLYVANNDTIEYLIVTCVKSKNLLDLKIGYNDTSNMMVLINKNFSKDHPKLYLYFKKQFINSLNFDYIMTDNIDKHCFNPVKFNMKFDSFEQLENLNNTIPTLLFQNE